jgi:chaperonin GroES
VVVGLVEDLLEASGECPAAPTMSEAAATVHEMAADGKLAIQMLADRVLVQLPTNEGERTSRSGILIPATAEVAKRLAWAEVMAVGPHVRMIKPGDRVLFNPEDRFEVEVKGDDYLILRERDIHAVASERMDGSTGLYL